MTVDEIKETLADLEDLRDRLLKLKAEEEWLVSKLADALGPDWSMIVCAVDW